MCFNHCSRVLVCYSSLPATAAHRFVWCVLMPCLRPKCVPQEDSDYDPYGEEEED